MRETLAEKVLSDGAKLQLGKYQLDQESAEVLGRPVGSDEMTINLITDMGENNTPPRVSWYLSEAELRKVYDAIKNKPDFNKVRQFLDDEINSLDDSYKVSSFLETL
jgi:hypothetical protein